MKQYHIELTCCEQTLVASIDFESVTHESFLKNQKSILSLLKSLSERSAIPKHRLSYWTDPDYNISPYKNTSNRGVFERNGRSGCEIYTHPSFLKYLRYFLYGVDLQDELIERFKCSCTKDLIDFKYVTSSDIIPICKHARKVARIAIQEYGLSKRHVTEELFKLCLELKLSLIHARSVRDYVARVNVR